MQGYSDVYVTQTDNDHRDLELAHKDQAGRNESDTDSNVEDTEISVTEFLLDFHTNPSMNILGINYLICHIYRLNQLITGENVFIYGIRDVMHNEELVTLQIGTTKLFNHYYFLSI